MGCVKLFKCNAEGCSSEYTCKGNLNRHIRSSHPEVYDAMITSKSVHPRARTINLLTQASSTSSINHNSAILHTSTVTVSRMFRCDHDHCKAEMSTYEGWSRHQSEIHGKKQNQCNIDGCTLMFARKEQLRSHMNRFHGVTVSPVEEVWSSELHKDSHLYGPRRESLKLLKNADESHSDIRNKTCTQLQSQQADLFQLKDTLPIWSQPDLNDHVSFTLAPCEVVSQDNSMLLTQNVELASTSQVSNMYSANEVVHV